MSNFKYRNDEKLPYPFCPGCSHGPVLDKLDEALKKLQIDPKKIVVVTDIGCVGLSDQWFTTNALHVLHGRSVVYAEGVKLANPNLKVITILGDGGAGIGGHHLLNAAKRNIGITVLLFNNFNFGMTGGEHSVTTPHKGITKTTILGHFEQPLKLCETLKINGAGFVARRGFFDRDLIDVIAEAIMFEGFAFVEVMELCTAYFSPMNKFRKSNIENLLKNQYPRMKEINTDVIEYTKNYKKLSEELKSLKKAKPVILKRKFNHGIKSSDAINIVIAGSAGQKIRSVAALLGRAAIMSGLYAVQKDDYPVTVQTGFSISFLKLSKKPVGYMGTPQPDILILVSNDGVVRSKKYIKKMSEKGVIYALNGLSLPETRAKIKWIDLSKVKKRIPKQFLAISMVQSFLNQTQLLPQEALKEAITISQKKEIAEKNLSFISEIGKEVFAS